MFCQRHKRASTTCSVVSRRGGDEKSGLESTRKRPFSRLSSEALRDRQRPQGVC